jgi:hypothetical protein
MNSNGVSIISSSLNPVIGGVSKNLSKDGMRIRDALAEPTVEKAVRYLQKVNVKGCVMVFDRTQLWLIEGAVDTKEQVVRPVNATHIARANHGVWLPAAGYQPGATNTILQMRRLSSEARLAIGRYIGQTASSPAELLTMMAHRWTDNPQLTTLRRPEGDIETRTTEQLMLEPGANRMIVRNTDGVLDFDQDSANPPGSQVLVGIV